MLALGLAGFGAGGFHCRVDDLGVSRCGNLFLCNKNLVADGAVFTLSLAGCGAGWLDCRVDDLGVSLRGNFLLCNDDRVADRAMLALGLAGFGAGSFNSIINDFGVTLGGDFLNSGDRCAADRAFDARRMTGFRAGGRLFSNINERMTGCIKHFGLGFAANSTSVSLDTGIAAGRGSRNYALVPAVTLRRNLFLCNKNLVADRAVFTLSLAGFGAGRLNSRINDLGMALGRDFFLGNEYSIADGAVLAFGQTSLSAGWSLCCIDYFCVAGRRDFFHTGENRITNGALRTGCMTSLGAGCGLLGNFNGSMTGSSDCFCFGFVANRAGVGLDTGIFTGRSGRDLALVPAVSLRGNLFCLGRMADRAGKGLYALVFAGRLGRDLALIPTVALGGDHFLGNEDFVADRAVLTLGQTSLRAGRSLCCIDYFCVAGRIDFSRLGRIAAITLASALFFALFRAGRGSRYSPFAPVVTKRGYLFHAGESRAADRALRAGCVSGLGAGCRLFSNINRRMTGSIDFSCLGRIAAITLASALFFTLFRAGRGSRYSPFAPVMTKRGNNLTVADLLIAVRAVGIAGISGLGASGVFRVADLGVLM